MSAAPTPPATVITILNIPLRCVYVVVGCPLASTKFAILNTKDPVASKAVIGNKVEGS